MAIFNVPRSFHSNDFVAQVSGTGDVMVAGAQPKHPSFLHLILLVFEAVLEVVCVSLPGYIAAQQGMFDADAQKFVANLNVTLFTPCLSTYGASSYQLILIVVDRNAIRCSANLLTFRLSMQSSSS